ncbi:Para-Rep [Seminavis robusta]|uniref:Para-Rep n=1 Tax=Seminavis robusta TaxID=568900 RepID=A0A9N8ERR2_9STRA|nr:Para-Rep [Seminavis robusta]|eukprot:Sro1500_g277820.1 Para-Rep (387) ;mRNA; f:7245-8405
MSSSGRRFVFTLHHWTDTDWEYLPRLCDANTDIEYMKVAKETGSEGDTPHLQGCVQFVRDFKQRESKVSKILMGPNKDITRPDPKNPGKHLKHHYHVRLMRGSTQKAADYCGSIAKEEGCEIFEYGHLKVVKRGERSDIHDVQEAIKKMAQEGTPFVEVEETFPKFFSEKPEWVRRLYNRYRKIRQNFFEEHEMFKWQRELVEYLNDYPPDPRKIIFIVDEEGNGGKSEILRNIEFLFPKKAVFGLAPQDVVSMSSLYPDDGADIVIMDCPRQQQYNDLAYKFLEQVKNGSLVQTKYQCQQKEFRIPHVVVLMNRRPKTGTSILFEDRYIIKEIELEPDEKERLHSQQTAALPPYLAESVTRTREILAECEEVKEAKRARYSFNEQ